MLTNTESKKKKGDYYNEYICHKYQGKDKSIYFIQHIKKS